LFSCRSTQIYAQKAQFCVSKNDSIFSEKDFIRRKTEFYKIVFPQINADFMRRKGADFFVKKFSYFLRKSAYFSAPFLRGK